jgi:hypothetical protein
MVGNMPELTDDQIKNIARTYFKECLDRFDAFKLEHEGNRWALPSGKYEDHPEGMKFENAVSKVIAPFVMDQEKIDSGCYLFDMNDHVIESQSLQVDKQSGSYKALADGMRDVQAEFMHLMREFCDTYRKKPSIQNEDFKSLLADSGQQPPVSVSELFSSVSDKYLDDISSSIVDKTAGKRRAAYALWVRVMGDVPIQNIVKQDVVRFKDVLRKLPVNMHQRYGDLSIEELLEMNVSQKMSDRTVNGYLASLSVLFKWATDHAYYEGNNPAEALRIRVSSNASVIVTGKHSSQAIPQY